MLWLDGKNELRAIRHGDIFPLNADTYEGATTFGVDHHSGVPWTLQLPPGVESFDALPRFDEVDAAWKSIDDDYCPSLHP
jgi:hypothetical protein